MPEAGRYKLVARLGEGGMAEVFKAVKEGPEGWEKAVALKRILPHLADNESFIHMLSAEARLHAHLDHPNLVHLLDFFQDGSTYFIVMEYIPGPNLRKILNDVRAASTVLPWPLGVHIACEVLKGLDFAHKRNGPNGPLNIVHRDISPQNILISYEGLVKVSDFGIALGNITRDKTESGVLKGKQRYLAPEQLESKVVDARADLFSMIVVLYECITGQHPFDTGNDFETMKRISEIRYKPIDEVLPDLPLPISFAITKTLQAPVESRFRDAAELRQALLSGQSPDWLGSGTEKLRHWMTELYPKPADRAEAPVEKTPVMSRHGTPLPPTIEPSASLISGIAEISGRHARRKSSTWPWLTVSILIFAGIAIAAVYLWFRSQEHPSPPVVIESTPPPAITAAALELTPTMVPATVPPEMTRTPTPLPKTGTLTIEGPTGAMVNLNGKSLGKLPMKPRTLRPGSYLVVIAPARGEPLITTVRLRAGDQRRVTWKTK